MAERVPQVGELAPDFSLPSDQDTMVRLSDFRGRRVVLYFYPEDDTPGCTTQACSFRDNYLQVEEQNAVVLGVSPDSAASHRRFKTKYNLPFTLLVDADHAVAEKYGAWGERTSSGTRSETSSISSARSMASLGWSRATTSARDPTKPSAIRPSGIVPRPICVRRSS